MTDEYRYYFDLYVFIPYLYEILKPIAEGDVQFNNARLFFVDIISIMMN